MRRRMIVTAACALLAVKAVLGLWAAFALLTASDGSPRTFLTETISRRNVGLGLLLLALAAITLFVIVGLWRGRRWARPAAIALEGLAIVLAFSRIGSATGAAIIAIVLGIAVIGLLVALNRAPASAKAEGRA